MTTPTVITGEIQGPFLAHQMPGPTPWLADGITLMHRCSYCDVIERCASEVGEACSYRMATPAGHFACYEAAKVAA